jgi:hypothetical protein
VREPCLAEHGKNVARELGGMTAYAILRWLFRHRAESVENHAAIESVCDANFIVHCVLHRLFFQQHVIFHDLSNG